MNRLVKGVVAVVGLFAAWAAWGVYVARTTPRVEYERVLALDDTELRRYPELVLVETTAPTAGEAFGRLFAYIGGANAGDESVSMTAPVRTRGAGAHVPMTAPVRTRDTGDGVTMEFYLPSSYTPASAPEPTDPSVSLAVEAPRTVAVRTFSWYATRRRVERETASLRATLADAGIETDGDPFVLQYNDPWTPPFLRTNEVAVEVADRP